MNLPPDCTGVVDGPLRGWRVLIPRTPEQSIHLRDLLTAAGAEPVLVPTIRILAPEPPDQLNRAITQLAAGHYRWLVLTSANAVAALRASRPSLPQEVPATTQVAAVGASTAAAATAWGLTIALVPDGAQNSTGLADEFPAAKAAEPVLLPRSDLADSTLPQTLRDLGWLTDEVVAYRTAPADPPSAELLDHLRELNAVLFTSSSTVTGLLELVGPPADGVLIASIGPRTTASCRERGLPVHLEASQPSAQALVDALVRRASQPAGDGEPGSGSAE